MFQKLILTLSVAVIAATIPWSVADEKTDKPKASDEAASKTAKSDAKSDESKKDDKKKDEPKFNAKCPVSGEAASKEQVAAYRDKEVYFCCEKCKAAFEADSAKYSTKANHQLVQTKQFKQTKCPLSGGDLNKEQSITVNGVKVTFCCDKCKGSLSEASADDRLTKVFADEVFAKSFEARAAKKDDSAKSAEKEKSEKTEKPAKSAEKKK